MDERLKNLKPGDVVQMKWTGTRVFMALCGDYFLGCTSGKENTVYAMRVEDIALPALPKARPGVIYFRFVNVSTRPAEVVHQLENAIGTATGRLWRGFAAPIDFTPDWSEVTE